MRVDERTDGGDERRILTALVTNTDVLTQLAPHWPTEKGSGLFNSRQSNLIAQWCVNHFKKFGQAPNRQIVSHLERWTEKARDDNTVKLVEAFLSTLSNHYESEPDAPPDFYVDLATTYWNRVKRLRLAEQIKADIEVGDDDKAEERIQAYHRIEIGLGSGVDLLRDKAAVKSIFQDTETNLIEYPEALGNFFRGELVPDSLVSFLGSTARGKTFWLLDMAWRAMEQGQRVAFFEVGDMSERQIYRRFMVRAVKRPAKATPPEQWVRYPKFIEVPPKSKRAAVSFKSRRFKNPLDFKTAWKTCCKITRTQDETKLKISTHANGTITVDKIAQTLAEWDREGWTSQILIIDYADLLCVGVGKSARWERMDVIWRELRGLSQSRHCLLITATQANAEALQSHTLKAHHFGGTIGGQQNCTAVVAISQTDDEKRRQVCRLNWHKRRENEFDPARSCHVAQCLDIGNPAVKSIF